MAHSPRAGKLYVVKPPVGRFHESLWEIAQKYLGDGRRYREIFELNKDRIQPDGSRLTIASLIRPGWVLHMPRDAQGPGLDASPAGDSPAGDAGPAGTSRRRGPREHGDGEHRHAGSAAAGEPLAPAGQRAARRGPAAGAGEPRHAGAASGAGAAPCGESRLGSG